LSNTLTKYLGLPAALLDPSQLKHLRALSKQVAQGLAQALHS
jgi:hypothetical protein